MCDTCTSSTDASLLCSQGQNLLKGLSESAYRVFIGEQVCAILSITNSSIRCVPPNSGSGYHVVKVTCQLQLSKVTGQLQPANVTCRLQPMWPAGHSRPM